MMKSMMKILTAVAVCALVAGKAKAIDMTAEQDPYIIQGASIDWVGTSQDWTERAEQAGYGYAYDSDAMGVWSSSAHNAGAIAKTLRMPPEDVVADLEGHGVHSKSMILYVEQLTLISACLANINDRIKLHFQSIKAELENP